jgi:CBS domain-containing protein
MQLPYRRALLWLMHCPACPSSHPTHPPHPFPLAPFSPTHSPWCEPRVQFLSRHGGARPPVTATPADTLSSVVELLCAAHVHRVHIVDAHRKPIGVVTSMDVLRVLLSSEVTAFGHGPVPAPAGASVPTAGAGGAGADRVRVEEEDPVLCPLVKKTFAAYTAAEFLAHNAAGADRLVEVPGDMAILDAVKVRHGCRRRCVGWVLVLDRCLPAAASARAPPLCFPTQPFPK